MIAQALQNSFIFIFHPILIFIVLSINIGTMVA